MKELVRTLNHRRTNVCVRKNVLPQQQETLTKSVVHHARFTHRGTGADGCVVIVTAGGPVIAGVGVTVIHLLVTVMPAESSLTHALVAVHQLYAVLGTVAEARVGQTLVHVPLAAFAHVPGQAPALEPAHAVLARSPVVAAQYAVVHVGLAQLTQRTRRAGALEIVDEIVAGAPELAGHGRAFVNVHLAVLALEPFGTGTVVHSHTVRARGTVPARGRGTLVDLRLAVASVVAGIAVADVMVLNILTCATSRT